EVNKPFTPVLIDFGVATKVIPPPAATPYIMPPEQIKQVQLQTPPEMDRVDPVKVDVWGLGIMLYCMLGGQLPFKSRREKTLTDRIIRSRPLSLQALSPDVPPDLEELVIDGCLAKDPAHRLTLLEVGQLLRKYVDGRSEVTAQTSGSPAKKSGWASLFGR
ncbi:MAG: hypothetical protein KC425_22710, partial [Anaerolineales bacterium]|nr:hypothetical protein [Anaerolineales bacterium]